MDLLAFCYMKYRFQVGKSYFVIGGLKLKVLARSQEIILGYMYCSGFKTRIFEKKIFIQKNEEVLICNDVVFCGAKYFFKGVKNEKYTNWKD